jgi:hypothetical protein
MLNIDPKKQYKVALNIPGTNKYYRYYVDRGGGYSSGSDEWGGSYDHSNHIEALEISDIINGGTVMEIIANHGKVGHSGNPITNHKPNSKYLLIIGQVEYKIIEIEDSNIQQYAKDVLRDRALAKLTDQERRALGF